MLKQSGIWCVEVADDYPGAQVRILDPNKLEMILDINMNLF